MNNVYGFIMVFIGIFFIVSAFMETEFIVYRIMTSRSKLLWKHNVHHFYKVVGIILVVLGFLFIFDVF